MYAVRKRGEFGEIGEILVFYFIDILGLKCS